MRADRHGNGEVALGIACDDVLLRIRTNHTVHIERHALHRDGAAEIRDRSAHRERRIVHKVGAVVHASCAQRHLCLGGRELVRPQARDDLIQRSVAHIRDARDVVSTVRIRVILIAQLVQRRIVVGLARQVRIFHEQVRIRQAADFTVVHVELGILVRKVVKFFGSGIIEVPVADEPFFVARQVTVAGQADVFFRQCLVPYAHLIQIALQVFAHGECAAGCRQRADRARRACQQGGVRVHQERIFRQYRRQLDEAVRGREFFHRASRFQHLAASVKVEPAILCIHLIHAFFLQQRHFR